MKLIYQNNITELINKNFTNQLTDNFTDNFIDNFIDNATGSSTSNATFYQTLEIEHLKANCTEDKDFNGPDEPKNSTQNSCDQSDDMGF